MGAITVASQFCAWNIFSILIFSDLIHKLLVECNLICKLRLINEIKRKQLACELILIDGIFRIDNEWTIRVVATRSFPRPNLRQGM